MNREDIIRMAQEAGFVDYELDDGTDEAFDIRYVRFAILVATAENEACAEICKKHADVYAKLEQNPTVQSAWAACIDNRDTIRARGQA